MQLTDKDYERFKQSFEKEGIKYETEKEYREAINNLVAYAELAFDIAKEEYYRLQRLKDEPKGFLFLGEGRTCTLCCRNIMGDMWYDKWGQKCMDCQGAYNKKIVPGYVFKDRDNHRYITASTLSWQFKVPTQTINKLIRSGILKARVVPHNDYGSTVIFLRSENPNLPDVIEHELARLALGKHKSNR